MPYTSLKIFSRMKRRIIQAVASASIKMNCRNFCTSFTNAGHINEQIRLRDEKIATIRNKNDDAKAKLSISFELNGKQKNLQRQKVEPLGHTLKRIYLNAVVKPKKKKGKSCTSDAVEAQDDIKVEIIDESNGISSALSEDILNTDAWKSGRVLLIGSERYYIDVNPPTVLSLELPDNVMAGFPVIPLVTLELATRIDSRFFWYKRNLGTSEEGEIRGSKVTCCEENEKWNWLGEGFTYKPSNDDIGFKLKVICVPANKERSGDIPKEIVSSVPVSAGPGPCPFENRHVYTMKKTDDNKSFRVVSYNILADVYATSEYARKVLYPYCMEYALDINYRRQLILKEIIGYNGDIICLQECDFKEFNGYYTHALEVEDFIGLFFPKVESPEGEAIFFRRKLFSLVSQHDIAINKALEFECNKEVFEKLKQNPVLLERFRSRGQIGQITILKDKRDSKRIICVVNTHLYFRPDAGHIRLLQMVVLVNYLQSIVIKLRTELMYNSSDERTCHEDSEKVNRVAVLLCGDLNSIPQRDSGVINYLLHGHLEANHSVWMTDKPEESGLCLELSHSMKLFSACGFPEFTNFVKEFHDTLDYIFADSEEFNVQSVIPLPPREELELYTALPSVVMPSDHLALVCNMSWK